MDPAAGGTPHLQVCLCLRCTAAAVVRGGPLLQQAPDQQAQDVHRCGDCVRGSRAAAVISRCCGVASARLGVQAAQQRKQILHSIARRQLRSAVALALAAPARHGLQRGRGSSLGCCRQRLHRCHCRIWLDQQRVCSRWRLLRLPLKSLQHCGRPQSRARAAARREQVLQAAVQGAAAVSARQCRLLQRLRCIPHGRLLCLCGPGHGGRDAARGRQQRMQLPLLLHLLQQGCVCCERLHRLFAVQSRQCCSQQLLLQVCWQRESRQRWRSSRQRQGARPARHGKRDSCDGVCRRHALHAQLQSCHVGASCTVGEPGEEGSEAQP